MIKRFFMLFLIIMFAVSMIYATTEYIKVNDNEIKIITTTTKEDINVYPYEWLIAKRSLLIRQKNEAIVRFDNKIAEIDILIAKCKELGIAELEIKEPVVEKVKEPIVESTFDSGEVIIVK